MMFNNIYRRNLFDDFFDDFARPSGRLGIGQSTPAPMMKTDVKEVANGFELDIELPGYKKEDITAELKKGYLTITAVKNSDEGEKDENGKYLRRERYFGSCSRSFYVGEKLNQEDITAKFEDGILKVNIPKKEPKPEIEDKHFINID